MHPHYQEAVQLLDERLKDVSGSSNGNADNYPGIIALLCCTANTSWEVKTILDILMHPTSSCIAADGVELFYCIALCFLYFKRNFTQLPSKYHFNIFQAIYFYESQFTNGCEDSKKVQPSAGRRINTSNGKGKSNTGQASLLQFAGFTLKEKSIKLTSEQVRIMSHEFDFKHKPNETVRIVAFAGTGKTTTLVRLCQKHQNLRFLVVMYNRSVKEHAIRQFPKNNVKCVTTHGMAFKKVGWMYAKNKLTNNLKAKDILNSDLMLDRDDSIAGSTSSSHSTSNIQNTFRTQQRAAQILKTIENFMNSIDTELTMECVPSIWMSVDVHHVVIDPLTRSWVLEDSLEVWKTMCDKEDTRIRMTHDGYLKLWQLRNPNLQYFEPHDVLLIDEGQDMNPPMLDIFLKQKTPKIVVGDPHQQIYMFRGAIDALNEVNSLSDVKTYYLTQSFRFGPAIGFIANCAIEHLKNNDSQTLVGGKKMDQLISSENICNENIDTFKPIAVIGRTNAGLFDHIVKFVSENDGIRISNQQGCSNFGITDCCCCNKNKRQLKACFAGGFDSYNFNDYLDIYFLHKGQTEKMKKYKTFTTFTSLKAFAKNTNDAELLSKIQSVSKYVDKLPNLIGLFEKYCKSDPKNADYVFSTAHKSKGLEWKSVVLLDDFLEIPGSLTNSTLEIEPDEKNLLYVAMTRAKRYLVISKNSLNLLVSSGNFLESVILPSKNSSPEDAESRNTTCVREGCENVFNDINRTHFKLKREMISVVPYQRSAGYLCSTCSCDTIQSIPVWLNNNIHHEIQKLVPDLYRASQRFVCGTISNKDFERAKSLLNSEDVFWQAIAVYNNL